MPEARRREIVAVAREHGLALVEDDVHGLLPEQRPLPLAALAPERTYYLTSTSKTLAPGLRIAYVKAPSARVPRLASSLRATTWAVAPLTAAIASAWIRDGSADALLAARREEARARQALARERLAGADFDAHPEAYYLWLRLPEPWRAEAFVAEARARGVVVTPAEAFAVDRDPVVHAVRLCTGAARTREALARGLDVVAELLATGGATGTPSSDYSSVLVVRSSSGTGRTKAARTGAGISDDAPRTDFQTISFSSRSGARSGTLEVHAQRRLGARRVLGVRLGRATRAPRARGTARGRPIGAKAANSGVAAASYWLIGGRPRISSIVRSTDAVEYSVESSAPRRVQRARDQQHRAVRVDVVGAVLRVVLEHEDRRLRPEPAVRDRLHHAAEREVVLGDHRARRARARAACPPCGRRRGGRC